MFKHRSNLLGLVVLSLTTLLIMGGCGGSSSSGTNNPQSSAGKATVSGAVSFPSMGSLVAKRTGKIVIDQNVTVKAYTIDGKEVASANPTFDDTTATRVYSYTIANLEPGVDYVIKVSKGGAVLKKLIEKKDFSGTLVGQNINSVSTSAVIIASKQLGAVLGDVLPSGKTVAELSTKISADIKPMLLEATIQAVVDGRLAGVTDSNKAAFANIYNIVVTSGSEGVDPAAMFTDAPPTLTNKVPILTVAQGATVATVTLTVVNTVVVTNNTAPTYTPPTITELAATYNSLAKINLTAQDISNAALNYEKALSIDPNDPEANFGGAITSGMMMIEDPDVQAIITKWGAVAPTVNQVVQGTSPVKLPFGNLTSIKLTPKTTAKSVGSVTTTTAAQNVLTAFSVLKAKLPQQKSGFKSLAKELNLVPATAPTISEMQTLIDNVIIPRIDKIIARLAKAEAAKFSFIITKAMQGNPAYGSDVTLDAGEFYTLDAALNIFQILFKIASSYSFDIPSPYTYDTIGQDPIAMINSSTVLTLKSGGAAKMAGALDNAKSAAVKAKLAYDIVALRTAGTGMFDLTSWTPLQKSEFNDGLAKVTVALTGPYDLSFNGGTKIVRIDATKFFINPLTRANLPTFGYDVTPDPTLTKNYGYPVAGVQTMGTAPYTWTYVIESKIVPTSDIPDYTLNGILPNNSPVNNIADFTGILPKLDGKLLSQQNADLFFASNSKVYTGATKFYFGYNATNTTTGVINRAVYNLDPTTGSVTPYCTDVTGIPLGMNYQSIAYFANPAGLYARLWNGVNKYEFRAITLNGTSCSIAATATKTVTLPAGTTGFTFENIGDNLDPLLHYIMFTAATSTTQSTNTIYSNVDPAALITLDNTRSLFQIRNGTIAVRSNFENLLEQYAIGADGKTITPSGSFINIDYLPNYGEKKMLIPGGGFYWLFDGRKMIKYAGKPNGTNY